MSSLCWWTCATLFYLLEFQLEVCNKSSILPLFLFYNSNLSSQVQIHFLRTRSDFSSSTTPCSSPTCLLNDPMHMTHNLVFSLYKRPFFSLLSSKGNRKKSRRKVYTFPMQLGTGDMTWAYSDTHPAWSGICRPAQNWEKENSFRKIPQFILLSVEWPIKHRLKNVSSCCSSSHQQHNPTAKFVGQGVFNNVVLAGSMQYASVNIRQWQVVAVVRLFISLQGGRSIWPWCTSRRRRMGDVAEQPLGNAKATFGFDVTSQGQ